jgi:hypothetical protein
VGAAKAGAEVAMEDIVAEEGAGVGVALRKNGHGKIETKPAEGTIIASAGMIRRWPGLGVLPHSDRVRTFRPEGN